MTTLTMFYGFFLAVLALMLVAAQRGNDSFDLRDVICSWDADKQVRIVSTSKTLLAGAFVSSSYYIIRHPDTTAFAAYLLAWVTNGGVVAWQKVKTAEAAK